MFSCGSDSYSHLPLCLECGGSEEMDSEARRMNQCDGPGKHRIPIQVGRKTFNTRICPRKLARKAGPFWEYWRWREKNCLEFICRPEHLPAKVAEAMDYIDDTLADIKAHNVEIEEKKRNNRLRKR